MSWGAVAVGGAALISGAIGADAAGDAASIQAGATDRASQLQMQMFQELAKGLEPFRAGGTNALQRLMFGAGLAEHPRIDRLRDKFTKTKGGTEEQVLQGTIYSWGDPETNEQNTYRYSDGSFGNTPTKTIAGVEGREVFNEKGFNAARARLLERRPELGGGDLMKDFAFEPFEFDADDLRKDPGYRFQKREGEQALTRAAAARGLAQSTPGLKELARFNQGLAATHFDSAFRRNLATNTTNFSRALGVHQTNRDNTVNLLMSLAGMGQNAAAHTGNAGMVAGGNAANAILAGGQGAANAALTGGAAVNNAIQGGIGNYLYQQRFDEMMKRFPVFNTIPADVAAGYGTAYGG